MTTATTITHTTAVSVPNYTLQLLYLTMLVVAVVALLLYIAITVTRASRS